jgi:hypothetical protein
MDFKNFISEEKGSTAVMAFGRYNPPTTGHQKLFDKVHEVAKEHNGEAHIIASHSEGTSKDPLPQHKKIGYIKKVVSKGTKVSGSSKDHPSIFHHAARLHAAGHEHLVVVAGSDRVDEYEKSLKKYNGVEGRHGHYNFKSIKVVSAGHRDPDAEGAEGMSASKLKGHARAGEFEHFKAGLHPKLHPHAKEMYDHIRSVGEAVDSFLKISEPEGTASEVDIKNKMQSTPPKFKAKLKKLGESQIPVLLISKQRLLGEETQVEYDTIVTKNFDICPSAVKAFSKHIEDANAGTMFMFYPLTLDVSPLVKQRELLKAAIEATDGYLGVEKIAVANNRATPNMVVDFNYFVRRAVQSLELMGVLFDHDYIQGHVDTVAKLANPAVRQPVPGATTYESYKIDESSQKGLVNKAEQSEVSLETLTKVFVRGLAEWKENHKPGSNPQQWGMARVNSFIMKGKTYNTLDVDLKEEEEKKQDAISEEEMDKMVEELDWEDIAEFYSQDELVDDSEEELDEALSAQARIKKRQSFARFKGRRGIARTMKLRRASDMNTLQRRAKLAARRALYRRFLKGRDKSSLSASEKDRIEQQVGRLKIIQTTLAQRMMPKIRSIEQKRLASYRSRKK